MFVGFLGFGGFLGGNMIGFLFGGVGGLLFFMFGFLGGFF